MRIVTANEQHTPNAKMLKPHATLMAMISLRPCSLSAILKTAILLKFRCECVYARISNHNKAGCLYTNTFMGTQYVYS